MSLLLCRNEPVKHPFHIEKLGLRIYSSQELSYIIYNHPLLAMNQFVDSALLEFIGDELDMGSLVMKLEKWKKGGGSYDEQLIVILQECCYYTQSEINKYKQQLSNYRKMHRANFFKVTADYYYSLKQYGKAVKEYEKIFALPRDQVVDDSFIGRIWNNIGSCYAGIFWFEKAMEAYDMAYSHTKSKELLKRIYMLTLLDEKLSLKERYVPIITDNQKEKWAEEFEAVNKKAYETNAVQEVVLLFRKDPIKRNAEFTALLAGWKREYRNMI